MRALTPELRTVPQYSPSYDADPIPFLDELAHAAVLLFMHFVRRSPGPKAGMNEDWGWEDDDGILSFSSRDGLFRHLRQYTEGYSDPRDGFYRYFCELMIEVLPFTVAIEHKDRILRWRQHLLGAQA
ncbi:hypothetical protein KBB41_03415 [Candidatus Curtissbacteria bacterium]|nr:hypothetical protein [Candidatus Curtissbacteria bacterium]